MSLCVCVCVRAGVCDNDRLPPHSNVGAWASSDINPLPVLPSTGRQFLTYTHTHSSTLAAQRDCANRIQHMYSRHAAVKGDGACGVVSFTGQCLTLTAQNEPIHFNKNMTKYRDEKRLHWVILHFNGCDKYISILQVTPKTLTFAVWCFFPQNISQYCVQWENIVSGSAKCKLLTIQMWKMHKRHLCLHWLIQLVNSSSGQSIIN